MNHPLHEIPDQNFDLDSILTESSPIKLRSSHHLASHPSPGPSNLPFTSTHPVHPTFNPSIQPRQPQRTHPTFQKLARAIKKSTSLLNRFIKGNRNPPATRSLCNHLPISVNLDPPNPLLSSTPTSSFSNPTSCPTCQHQANSRCLGGSSHSPHSLADFVPLDPCNSTTSSVEFSPRLGAHLDNNSPSSPLSKTRSNWITRLSQSRPMPSLYCSDHQPTHPILNSNPDRSLSSARSSSPGSSGTRRCCNSLSPNHLQPTFGIIVKEALKLASQEYQSPFGKAKIPIIVYKCGERLKCDKGIKSHGIFRINGNVKRMRKLESVFMNPDLGYGTYFDISDPNSPDLQAMVERPQSGLLLDSSSEPYFTLHDVAGVLRRYLWALPEPLVSYKVTHELIRVWRRFHAGKLDDSGETLIRKLERVLKQNMKKEELDLLIYLLEILGLFSIRSEDNLMNSKNLAIVFQPGIMPIPISQESQTNWQHSHLDPHPHPHRHLHQFPKSRSSDLISHHCQQNVSIDSQQMSSLQIASGMGLNDYLDQIDEVQEILSRLIDQFASRSKDSNVNDNDFQQHFTCELGSSHDDS